MPNINRKHDVLSTRCQPLDELLPWAGIRTGSIVEWTGRSSIAEAAFFSLLAMRSLLRFPDTCLLIDATRWLYPPGLVCLGLNLKQLLYLTPETDRDQQWCCEQALRCSSLPLTWVLLPRGTLTTFRRYQVVAESAGTIGMFVFDPQRNSHRCWGDARLQVESLPTGLDDRFRFQITVLRSRKGNIGESLTIEVDESGRFHECTTPSTDEISHCLPMVSTLASATVGVG